MRSLLFVSAIAVLGACTQAADDSAAPAPAAPVAIEAASGAYELDKNHTSVTVRALHFGLSHYTLRFTGIDASLLFNADDPTQSSIVATVNIPSVETDYPGPRDFDAELQNSEWLNAAEHPVAEFRSTSVVLTGANTGRISGDLSFAGATHPATFDVTFNGEDARNQGGQQVSRLGFSARAVIQRSQYGLMVLMPPPASSAGVSDDVEILIEAEFRGPIAAAPAAEPAPDAAPAASE